MAGVWDSLVSAARGHYFSPRLGKVTARVSPRFSIMEHFSFFAYVIASEILAIPRHRGLGESFRVKIERPVNVCVTMNIPTFVETQESLCIGNCKMQHFVAAVPAQINPQLCNCRDLQEDQKEAEVQGPAGDRKVWTPLAGKLDLLCRSGLGKLVGSRKVGTCLRGLWYHGI